MRSALKYKYKPQIRDGEAIEVPNVRKDACGGIWP